MAAEDVYLDQRAGVENLCDLNVVGDSDDLDFAGDNGASGFQYGAAAIEDDTLAGNQGGCSGGADEALFSRGEVARC